MDRSWEELDDSFDDEVSRAMMGGQEPSYGREVYDGGIVSDRPRSRQRPKRSESRSGGTSHSQSKSFSRANKGRPPRSESRAFGEGYGGRDIGGRDALAGSRLGFADGREVEYTRVTDDMLDRPESNLGGSEMDDDDDDEIMAVMGIAKGVNLQALHGIMEDDEHWGDGTLKVKPQQKKRRKRRKKPKGEETVRVSSTDPMASEAPSLEDNASGEAKSIARPQSQASRSGSRAGSRLSSHGASPVAAESTAVAILEAATQDDVEPDVNSDLPMPDGVEQTDETSGHGGHEGEEDTKEAEYEEAGVYEDDYDSEDSDDDAAYYRRMQGVASRNGSGLGTGTRDREASDDYDGPGNYDDDFESGEDEDEDEESRAPGMERLGLDLDKATNNDISEINTLRQSLLAGSRAGATPTLLDEEGESKDPQQDVEEDDPSSQQASRVDSRTGSRAGSRAGLPPRGQNDDMMDSLHQRFQETLAKRQLEEAALSSLEQERNELQQDLAYEEETVEQLQGHIRKLEGEMKRAETSISNLKKKAKAARSQGVTKVDPAIKENMKSQIEDHKAAKATALAALSGVRQDITKIRSRVKEAQAEAEEAESEERALELEIRKVQAALQGPPRSAHSRNESRASARHPMRSSGSARGHHGNLEPYKKPVRPRTAPTTKGMGRRVGSARARYIRPTTRMVVERPHENAVQPAQGEQYSDDEDFAERPCDGENGSESVVESGGSEKENHTENGDGEDEVDEPVNDASDNDKAEDYGSDDAEQGFESEGVESGSEMGASNKENDSNRGRASSRNGWLGREKVFVGREPLGHNISTVKGRRLHKKTPSVRDVLSRVDLNPKTYSFLSQEEHKVSKHQSGFRLTGVSEGIPQYDGILDKHLERHFRNKDIRDFTSQLTREEKKRFERNMARRGLICVPFGTLQFGERVKAAAQSALIDKNDKSSRTSSRTPSAGRSKR